MADVLIIDDAEDLRLLMRLALEADGHRVHVADGALAALALLDDIDVLDVVVLDVQMPAVDGWQALAAIRRHPRHGEVGVLVCTVKFSRSDLVRAWTLGCDGYLNKPFDLQALGAAVGDITSTDAATRADLRRTTLEMLDPAQLEA